MPVPSGFGSANSRPAGWYRLLKDSIDDDDKVRSSAAILVACDNFSRWPTPEETKFTYLGGLPKIEHEIIGIVVFKDRPRIAVLGRCEERLVDYGISELGALGKRCMELGEWRANSIMEWMLLVRALSQCCFDAQASSRGFCCGKFFVLEFDAQE